MKMFNWKRAALLIALSLIVIGTVGAGGKTEGTTGTTGGAAAEGKYKESPLLAAQVKAGELPPVDQRLPKEPVVVKPLNEIIEVDYYLPGYPPPSDLVAQAVTAILEDKLPPNAAGRRGAQSF